jgi:hypothetical protein
MFVMITGLGIIGALASILASLLVGASSSADEEEETSKAPSSTVETEPAQAGFDNPAAEIAAIRQLLQDQEKTSLALKEKLERLEQLVFTQPK